MRLKSFSLTVVELFGLLFVKDIVQDNLRHIVSNVLNICSMLGLELPEEVHKCLDALLGHCIVD